MKLIQISKTLWVNADQITYYDEQEQYLHFTDGNVIKLSADLFKSLILTLKDQVKKKAAAKKTDNKM